MTATLGTLDWIVLLAYLAITLGIAIAVRFGQKNLSDYFLAGRSMPFLVVAISLFATLFSTISFVGVPGEAYRNGILTFLTTVGYAICTPFAVWMFLKYFFDTGETFTAYEYLEHRFNPTARTLGSLNFLFARSLFGGTVIFAAARMFQPLVGWDPMVTVITVGIFSVTYTTIGGMRAAMITDVIQTLVLAVALMAIVGRVSWLIEFDFIGMAKHVTDHDHGFERLTRAEFYSFDPQARFTLWVLLWISITMPLQHYGTDQLVVQRFLASRSESDARRAIWVKTFMTPVLILILFLVGLLLFYFYSQNGGLPENVSPDQVMGHFIVTELASPLPGLIAAGLIAALMSTIDSTVGSLSTVTCMDLLDRWGWMPTDERKRIRIGKLLTVIWGTAIIAMAAGLTRLSADVATMVFELANILVALWGVLLVVMLAGVFTKWVTGPAAVVGLGAGFVVNLVVPFYLYFGFPPEERVSYAWVGVPGMLVTLTALIAVSLFTGTPRRATGNPNVVPSTDNV